MIILTFQFQKENIRYFVCDQNNCNGAEMDFGSACDISATKDDFDEYFQWRYKAFHPLLEKLDPHYSAL